MKRKIAVFLDRDGTINEEMGYLNHPDRFRLLPGVAKAIKKLNQAGVLVIVATNQSGVARGFFPRKIVEIIHQKMVKLLKEKGAFLDKIYFCAHHPEENCPCRKPKSGMLGRAAKDFNLNLEDCFVVGDRIKDIEWAHRVGAQGILVLTGYGKGEYEYMRDRWKEKPECIAENLYQAVKWILQKLKIKRSSTIAG